MKPEDAKHFREGARVKTPKGTGKVLYVRFAPPDFTKVQAVSVFLDARKGECCYAGSLFPANDVSPA